MTGDRLGNPQRRRLLLDSRDEPWSVPERRFHRLLRDAGITGWRANLPVRIGDARCYLDVAFELVLLAIEIDGRLYHSAPEAFELDRRRQNLLVLNGWHVLRFTWRMIEEHPDQVIVAVRDALEMLSNRTISLQTRASDQW